MYHGQKDFKKLVKGNLIKMKSEGQKGELSCTYSHATDPNRKRYTLHFWKEVTLTTFLQEEERFSPCLATV